MSKHFILLLFSLRSPRKSKHTGVSLLGVEYRDEVSALRNGKKRNESGKVNVRKFDFPSC